MRSIISRFLADQSGATAVEYAILTAVLALAIFAGLGDVFNSIGNVWTRIAVTLDDSWN